MVAVVPLTDALHESAAVLFATAHPQRAADLDAWTELGMQRWAAVDGDALVGFATAWRVHDATFRIELVVDPARRRRGVGGALLAELLRLDARVWQARPAAADTASIGFLARRGFTETMRMHHLALVLAQARHAAYRDRFDALAQRGIAIVTLADYRARRTDADTAFLDCVEAVLEGRPDEAVRAHPFTIVAEQAKRVVGFASALGTGVRPELRGHGIATALEVAVIDAAIARGERVLRTATGDAAMKHIDEKLGYVETAREVRMVYARP